MDKISCSQQNQTNDFQNELFWTPLELQEWIKSGLIPLELFEESRHPELVDYLKKNKETLHAHSKSKTDDVYQIKGPLSYKAGETSELQVIDKQTGEVVNILEQMRSFELCEGISLKIKDKELPEWEKDTVEARKLNKEQNETLKATLEKLGPERPLTRKDILKIIEEVRRPHQKQKKYRQSGHLIDQKLKYQSPSQPSLFDLIMPETKQKIEESRIEVKAEGIKLTYAENKLVHSLNLLLYEKSQNSDPKADNFYGGNAPTELVPYGLPDHQARAPILKFRPAELYKAFTGTSKYSGADVKFIINTLHQLEDKKVLIKYDRVKKVKDGNKTKTLTDRIEDFQSLIKIVSFIPDLSDSEKTALDEGDSSIREARGEIIIALNPIFRDQIDTKFIEFPEDTNRRLVIAAGGHKKVTASMQTLMEYALREISAKRYRLEINEDNLTRILGLENNLKQKRNKRLQERISKDIQAIINIGLIVQSELVPNSVGTMKWIFLLNKDYE